MWKELEVVVLTVPMFLMALSEITWTAGFRRLCDTTQKQKCYQPLQGYDNCRAAHVGYRFNHEKRRCEEYRYGCPETPNHFSTWQECQLQCGQCFGVDPCPLPKDVGYRCRGKRVDINYWFNKSSQTCELFQYNGCGGNGNNFIEQRECWDRCASYIKNVCKYPIHGGGSCLKGNEFTKDELVFGYNNVNGKCEKFLYGGCYGYSNRFKTAKDCWRTCANTSHCLLPKRGRKSGLFGAYTYDQDEDACKRVRYTFGGDFWPQYNKFSTLEQCQHECSPFHQHTSG
uniref:BPTI/Kunitz inhibitor domain-containing protein n=1 Tax=Amblyomma tuberculatum TaxID=48802 RepID=A0A6M2E5D7_9ACAR